MRYAIGTRCALNQKRLADFSNWRIYAMVFLFLTVIAVILLRLYSLQVIAYDSYKALAEGQHGIFQKLIPKRGEIFLKDKDGVYPAAVNKNTQMAYAIPKEVKDAEAEAGQIAQILQLDKDEIQAKLNKPDDMYEVLKHLLSDDEIQKIKDAKLEGIHLADEVYRYYPSSELASNVLGFVGWKDSDYGGRYGIEAYEDEKLKGQEGTIFQQRDALGRWAAVGTREITDAKDGDSLVLTIDHIVQYETEKILKSAVEKYQADSGSIIVMESSTGKILSMADYPNFNPNEYSKVDNINVFRNQAVSDAYECGSVFKTVTMAAGLDSDKISPDTSYKDTGTVKEAGYSIKNSDLKAYGNQTMTNVLEKSLNTGAIFVEKLVGNKNFSDYVKRFGFGETTNIDLMSESAGNIKNLANLKSDIQFFTASFGQGISVTPIQLLSAYNAIANGGILMKPQVVEKIIHGDGTEENIQPQEVRRVISERAALQTSQMLRSVVVNGHGKRADVPGYQVAGKTGTAQVASTDSRGYAEGKTIGSFAGFAPMNDPKFTVLIRMDDPKNVQWAESSAAPTFGELMKFLLEYYNIQPTEQYAQKDLDIFNATHTLSRSFIKADEADAPKENQPVENNSQTNKKKND